MVDALVSGASVERRAGSSPVLGTLLLVFSVFQRTTVVVSVLRVQRYSLFFESPNVL